MKVELPALLITVGASDYEGVLEQVDAAIKAGATAVLVQDDAGTQLYTRLCYTLVRTAPLSHAEHCHTH